MVDQQVVLKGPSSPLNPLQKSLLGKSMVSRHTPHESDLVWNSFSCT